MTDSGVNRTPPRPPKGLDDQGRKLWKSVVSAYQLRPDELFVLETACSAADIVARLEAEMRGQPLTVKGSMGQEREHPLLSEQRQQRALLTRSLAQLKLPDLEPGAADREAMARSIKARSAARSRWSHSRDGRAG